MRPTLSTFDPGGYAEIPSRLKQQAGYMTATSAAVLCCQSPARRLESQADPWRSLGDLIARYESEFAGRLLFDPLRPRRLAGRTAGWAHLGHPRRFRPRLLDSRTDRPRTCPAFSPAACRIIQLVETSNCRLAGSAEAGDDRGLTELGRACLTEIAALATGDHCRLPGRSSTWPT